MLCMLLYNMLLSDVNTPIYCLCHIHQLIWRKVSKARLLVMLILVMPEECTQKSASHVNTVFTPFPITKCRGGSQTYEHAGKQD